MKTKNYLLPYRFKMIGLALLIATAVFGSFAVNFGGVPVSAQVPGIVGRFGIPGIDHGPAYEWVCRQTDLDATLLTLGLMISLTFIALPREKIEDECMSPIRTRAFTLALWVGSAVLAAVSLFTYDYIYLNVMIANLFAYPAVFIVIQRVMSVALNAGTAMKNKIRGERTELRMTQQQLAEAIGVSRQSINAIEAGRFVPSTVLALKIARMFCRRVEEIFSTEESD